MIKNSFIIFFFLIFGGSLFAEEGSFSQDDRDRLLRLEVTLQEFKDSVDKRFSDLREDINKRFEQVDKRFERIDKRFGEMMIFLGIICGIFTTLTLGVIGFAYWDRKTIIRKAKEETISEIETEGRVKDLINALRELSRKNPELAEILKSFRLL